MKSAYINNGRIFRIIAILLCFVTVASMICISAGAVMSLPGSMGRSGEGVGMENNIPENGNAAITDTIEGNLGDTDGDGVVEDKGTGEGIIGDIGEMGSEIVSDIGEMGSDIISDIGDGMDGNTKDTTDRAPADSGTTDNVKDNGGSIVAVVIAIIIAIALIILIIAIIPRNKKN